ncbi:MAG: AAA family ATPase [Nitrososphaerales archaeon]
MSEPINEQLRTQPPQALVACMGVTACNRICSLAGVDSLKPFEGEGSLAYEYDCPYLDELLMADIKTPLPMPYRKELGEVVAMPNLDFLGAENTAEEAKAYLGYLQDGQSKFERYVVAVLRGSKTPRAAIVEAEEDWKEHDYRSPNAEVIDSLADDDNAKLSILYAQLRGFHDLASLKHHQVLFDKSAQLTIEQAASELSVGHHIKLNGEPGIAKTSIAKELGRMNARAHHPDWSEADCEPILISMSSTAEAEAQVSEQTFENNTLGQRLGLIAKAMKEGRTVVLDEQNGMTADQQVYFNDLFLKEPGKRVKVGNEHVVIQPGFAIIATMNPMTDTQGNRRHGRQQQDSAGSARYSRIDILYPGQRGYQGDARETLTRLFYANYVDQYGWQQPTEEVITLIDDCQEFLIKLTRMATEPPANGSSASGLLNSAQERPELAECITPRDFSRMLKSVMTHFELTKLPLEVRKAISIKTDQILHSDNGHYVTPAAARAVAILKSNNRFNYA